MAECIYFSCAIQYGPSQTQQVFTTKGGNEWLVERKWSAGIQNMIHEIVIRKRDYFESYYYVDLEISPTSVESDSKICKSGRMCSTNIQFIISGNEYSRFGAFTDVSTRNGLRSKWSFKQIFYYKIILTPIFQFMDVQRPKRFGKRTKIDLLKYLKTLSEDIGSLRNDEETADAIICCGEKQVKVHKNILSIRSPVFENLLCKTSKTCQGVQSCFETSRIDACSNDYQVINPSSDVFFKITLEDIDSSVFDDFINFIYTGKNEALDVQKAKYLFVAARNYAIQDLEQKCEQYLKSNIWKNTRDDIYKFACAHKCEELQNCVLDHVKNKILCKKEKAVKRTEKKVARKKMSEEQKRRDKNKLKRENEDEMDEEEEKHWMMIMKDHPTHLRDILTAKGNEEVYSAPTMIIMFSNIDN